MFKKLHECNTFFNMSAENQNAEIKKRKLCTKCLKDFYGRNCKAPNCKECHGYHNTLLHKFKSISEAISNDNVKSKSNEPSTAASQKDVATNKNANATLAHCSVKGTPQVLLSTVIVLVRDADGAAHECRALFNSGAQFNFITCDFNKKLNLRQKSINMAINGIGNTPVKIAQQKVHATIKSQINSFKVKLPFLIVDKITEPLPIYKINKVNVNIPDKIVLADSTWNIPSNIHMLIGADVFWDLMCSGKTKKSQQSLTLKETRLGWTISHQK